VDGIKIKDWKTFLTETSGDVEWPISPGMQVVAELKEGERTVMEYLLSPVKEVVGEAGRER